MRNESLHERWLRDEFHDALRRGTIDPKILADYLDRALRRDRNVYVDFVFQHSWDSTTVYDAFAYGLFTNWHNSGLLAFVSVEVGAGPESDRMVEANNLALAGMPSGFTARFSPGRGSGVQDDGRFSWSFELGASTYINGQRMLLQQPPGSIPLEVGYTRSSRTLRHLIEDGGLARWPYDSTNISAAILTPKGREALGCLAIVSKTHARVTEHIGGRGGAVDVRGDGRRAEVAEACADLGLSGAS